MRTWGLVAKAKKKFRCTTDSNHSLPVSPNLLNQTFVAHQPKEVWLSDITYIWTAEGWLYLCAILDVYSRRIVSWTLSERMKKELVLDTFKQAVKREGSIPTGMIFHSDRGSQYASHAFQQVLKDYHVQQSMSRRANCYDNAMMESFWHSLKVEATHDELFHTRSQARSVLFEYIEIYYNRERRHSALHYLAPVDFEQQYPLKVA